ncbi:MAG: hypothetical protein ACLPXT_15865 [Terracidiphilus sp.]
MTFEYRLLVGFEEIEAVVFECLTCKTRTSIPVAEFNKPPAQCPKQHVWNTGEPVLEGKPVFHVLAMLLGKLADPTLQKHCGFRVSLEFPAKKLERNDI